MSKIELIKSNYDPEARNANVIKDSALPFAALDVKSSPALYDSHFSLDSCEFVLTPAPLCLLKSLLSINN